MPSERIQELTDRATFVDAFRQFYPQLVRYVRGIVRNEDAADDVVQDAFLRLWEKRESLEVQVSLSALLYTMVRNRALNVNRQRERVRHHVPVEDMADRSTVQTGIEDELAAEDLRERIHRWVEELPERRAEAFKLSRYHGLRHQEIAHIMDISRRTVDTHIYHALQDLRERLDELQDFNDL